MSDGGFLLVGFLETLDDSVIYIDDNLGASAELGVR